MTTSQELFLLANKLSQFDQCEMPELDALDDAAAKVGQSWSGSWFGYHSRVYYANFKIPPPGAAFSQEWGLYNTYSMGSRGDWHEYDYHDVIQYIYELSGTPDDLNPAIKTKNDTAETFDELKSSALSLIHANCRLDKDLFLADLVKKIESLRIFFASDFINAKIPTGQMISRDMIAIEKGLVTPPHIICNGHCI